MVKTGQHLLVRRLFDSVQSGTDQPYTKSNIVFGEKITYDNYNKWWFIREHLRAIIGSGVVEYDLDDAMHEFEKIDKIFKLRCNVSMFEYGSSIVFSTRILTNQRNKKEDKMYATLGCVKQLLRRGAFAIFTINFGVVKCIKVHPGIAKFCVAAFNTSQIQCTIASEKLDGIQINVGLAEVDHGYILEFGNKDTDPALAFIPKKDFITEMNAAMRLNSTHAPDMAFNILVNAITKYPELIDWLTRHTCVFELLNKHMFEIHVGSEFHRLKTPELVLLSVFDECVKIPIYDEMCNIFRTPRTFVIGSPEYNTVMSSMNEGVVGLDDEGIPVLKIKTPAFVFFEIMSKLQLPTDMNQEELYLYVLDVVMKKCYNKGADPVQAKRFYIDNADFLSRIVYIISREFACGNFTIADITDPITGDCCNWGKIISSVIQSIL